MTMSSPFRHVFKPFLNHFKPITTVSAHEEAVAPSRNGLVQMQQALELEREASRWLGIPTKLEKIRVKLWHDLASALKQLQEAFSAAKTV